MTNKYDISDLIAATIEEKPIDFETAFNDMLIDKIRDAVEVKRIEVAQSMFNNSTVDQEE